MLILKYVENDYPIFLYRAYSWDSHWLQALAENSEKDDSRKAPENWKDEVRLDKLTRVRKRRLEKMTKMLQSINTDFEKFLWFCENS